MSAHIYMYCIPHKYFDKIFKYIVLNDNCCFFNLLQAIFWTNDGHVYWRIYASLGLDELKRSQQIHFAASYTVVTPISHLAVHTSRNSVGTEAYTYKRNISNAKSDNIKMQFYCIVIL